MAALPPPKLRHTEAAWLKQQRVCVTGGRGVLGRYLIDKLRQCGVVSIVSFDKKPCVPEEAGPGGTEVAEIEGDILSEDDLVYALNGCSLLFHLAAEANIRKSVADPCNCFLVNTQGTANVLDMCRRLGIRHMLITSTAYASGSRLRLLAEKNREIQPLSVYAASKLAAETIAHGYAHSYGFHCTIARLANIYGSKFNADTVVGSALAQAASGGPIALTDLSAVRDFVYAEDAAEALIRLAIADSGENGCKTYHVSTGRGVSVKGMTEFLATAASELGLGEMEILETGKPCGASKSLLTDPELLRRATGWTPPTTPKQGLLLSLRELLKKR